MATTSSRLRGRESLFAMTHRINRAHRQFKKAVQHGRASDHDYRWFLQARSLSLQGWGLIDLPLRASNEGSPRPPLREHIKSSGSIPSSALRARRAPGRTVLHCANKFRRLLLSIPLEGPSGRLPLRPSNEHILIVRVPGAQEPP